MGSGSFRGVFPAGAAGVLWMFGAGGVAAQEPAPVPALTVEANRLLWTPVTGATGYDVIRGDINLLHQSGDGLKWAVRACLADDLASTQLDYLGIPKVGEAFFFMVRASLGDAAGTFDTGGAGQVAPRDAAIDDGARTCFSTVVPREPIVIGGDNQFDAARGVVGGNGTFGDPYIISGWDIACSKSTGTTGIEVRHTTMPYLIRNVRVRSCGTGILLDRSRDGSVARSRLSGDGVGILVTDSGSMTIDGNAIDGIAGAAIRIEGGGQALMTRNTITTSGLGIDLDGALGCDLFDNNLESNTIQARDINGVSNRWNQPYPQDFWSRPQGGNHWSGYGGNDLCSGVDQGFCAGGGAPDGFADQPVTFSSGVDQYPRMTMASDEGDTLPPAVLIAPHAPSFTSAVDISGTAQDPGLGVRQIQARLNGGPWTDVTCCTSWSFHATLLPGDNVVEAQAADRAGNVSRIERAVVVYYASTVWQTILQTTQASYLPGSGVPFIVRVTNNSPLPATLNFSSSCEASFAVTDSGAHRVYDRRNHTSCFPVFLQRTVAAGGSITYSFAWLQTDDAGTQVPFPASYALHGVIDSIEPVPPASSAILITPDIEPFPQVSAVPSTP
jgi:hypothetical protein